MSKDVLDDLRTYVTTLADGVNDAVETPTASVTQPRRARRRWAAAGVAAAAAVVIIGATAQLSETGDNRVETGGDAPAAPSLGDSESDVEQSGPVRPGPTEAVTVLPDPPLDVRGDVAVVWSGEVLVVWGGDVEAANMGLPGDDRVFVDGAAFDPATQEWRLMSPGPLPATVDTPVAAATDDGVAIARGTAVALWDPRTDTWRNLPDAPAAVTDLTWTGRDLVSASANAVLALDADAWARLDAPPLALERPTTVWTGTELVVVGGPSTPFTAAAAISFDPEIQRWRTLPAPPSGLRAEALAGAWDGDRVVVVNYDMQAVAYDPTSDTWTRLPPVPGRFSESYPGVEAFGGYTVAFTAWTVAVLQPDGRWVPVPYGVLAPGPKALAPDRSDGGDPVIYSVGVNVDEERNVVTAFDPVEVDDRPPAVQVGVAAVTVPPGFTVAGARFDAGSETEAEAVTVELVREGESCVLTSSQGGPVKGPPLVVEESLDETPGVAWRRSEDATTWVATGDSGTLLITCDFGETAELLARSSSL